MPAKRTEQQERNAKAILAILGAAGWRPTDRAKVFGVADLTYENAAVQLEATYEWTDDLLYFTMIADGLELPLAINFSAKLEDVLQALISLQDQISEDNFRDHVRSLLRVCPSMFVDTGGALVPLQDDAPELG